ncbi:MAG: dihydrodipicolinate synthase family protein [Armatimonadota bacterium]|nr:dihydrodipicolinate synthase family protein [Armatimonadota bacterium]MDR7489518.1 dihydrodipicolinate synthase family protein [Armatimonadota bacterium]MDR7529063.1 dihydrodipicolinate synthase family protein [Armatimonadota bacterium]MDR7585112.1 dihydrodipicolinate synthase family protein [Armatimonadota bacterium]
MGNASAPLQGIFPYLVSPVDPTTGKVKTTVLGRLVEYLIEQGIHGLSPLGSTGEFPYLSHEQRLAIVRTTVQAAGGHVPVVPGVAAFATADAIQQAHRYLEAGATGIVLMLQTFFPLPPTAIQEYFATVAETAECPVILYSNPGVLGADLNPEIIIELSKIENISYYKDASGNTGRLLTILNGAGDSIRFFSASAHIPLLVFALGGVGWMSGPACVVPRQCVRLWDLWQRGNWDEAFALQRRLWRINELFQKYSLAACVKAGLELQGFDVGGPIPPQPVLDRSAYDEIATALQDLALVVSA